VRILFVNSGLRYGGAETQLIEILRELKRQGHEPSLYLLTSDAPRLPELAEADIPVTVDDKRARLDLAVLARLRSHIRVWQPDLVHGFLFDANIYARIAGIGLGLPILNSERNHGYKLRPMQSLIHTSTRYLVDGVVANSHAGREFARELFQLPAQRTHTVWNGLSVTSLDDRVAACKTDYRQLMFGDPKVKLAVLVGTITSQKDHLLAIAVAEELIARDPNWRVAFVGASYTETQIAYRTKAAIASKSLATMVHERWLASPHRERIAFVGQRHDAVEIIAAADVLLSTSRHEGFPNVVLEAMAVRTPVVSTDYSDIRLILPYPWQVVKKRDAGKLADAILRAGEESAAIVKAQRDWVEGHATIQRSATAMLDVYRLYCAVG